MLERGACFCVYLKWCHSCSPGWERLHPPNPQQWDRRTSSEPWPQDSLQQTPKWRTPGSSASLWQCTIHRVSTMHLHLNLNCHFSILKCSWVNLHSLSFSYLLCAECPNRAGLSVWRHLRTFLWSTVVSWWVCLDMLHQQTVSLSHKTTVVTDFIFLL